jgi:hypothetical protein
MPMSSQLFEAIFGKIMENIEVQKQGDIVKQRTNIKKWRFSDDIDLLAED